jgi:transporter family protein
MTLLADWRVFALGSALFAALTAIFAKVGVAGVNSNFATFLRTAVILVFTAGLVSFRAEWQPLRSLSSRTLLFLCLSGLATGFSWLCYFRALQLGPASKVAPVDKLSVAFVILLAFLFLGETLSWKTLAGAALILAGAIVLVI